MARARIHAHSGRNSYVPRFGNCSARNRLLARTGEEATGEEGGGARCRVGDTPRGRERGDKKRSQFSRRINERQRDSFSLFSPRSFPPPPPSSSCCC